MTAKLLQIEQIEAKELIERFESLEKRLLELQKAINPAVIIPPKQPDYMTRKEIAALFKISITTTHYWTRNRILKAYKVGHRVYFKRNEVEETLVKLGSREKPHFD